MANLWQAQEREGCGDETVSEGVLRKLYAVLRIIAAAGPLCHYLLPRVKLRLTPCVPGSVQNGRQSRMLGVRQGVCSLRSPRESKLLQMQERLLHFPQYGMRCDHGVCNLRPHSEATVQEEKADDDRFYVNSAIGVPSEAADVREWPLLLLILG